MADKYTCMAELESGEAVDRDYRIRLLDRSGSAVVVLAPHGGTIEVGTSELAELIAGAEHSLFVFEGLKPRGTNRDLHLTSHRFDHPACISLTLRHRVAVAVHGCSGEAQIYLGGLDGALVSLLGANLREAGFPASVAGHRYPGRHPLNICNRGARGQGVQLEMTHDLRAAPARARIAPVVRATLEEYLRHEATEAGAAPGRLTDSER
jgi:phage replication-related protein YjqB (UPF0714/DUF867 family)